MLSFFLSTRYFLLQDKVSPMLLDSSICIYLKRNDSHFSRAVTNSLPVSFLKTISQLNSFCMCCYQAIQEFIMSLS